MIGTQGLKVRAKVEIGGKIVKVEFKEKGVKDYTQEEGRWGCEIV